MIQRTCRLTVPAIVLGLLLIPAAAAAHHHDGEADAVAHHHDKPVAHHHHDDEMVAYHHDEEASDDEVTPSTPVAGEGAGSVNVDVGGHRFDLAVGLRLGAAGVAGHGFGDDEYVEDNNGRRIPSSADHPWYQPEYYPHFGVGPSGGLALEGRYNGFIGVETGLFFSQDNASGYVHKNYQPTGERIATIHSDQVTSSFHIPLLVKASVPSDFVRPFISGGLMFVVQQGSELNYSYEEGNFQSDYNEDTVAQLDERNQIEASNYTQIHGSAGVELLFGDIRVPVELRLGYTLGYDTAMEQRAYGEDGQIIYDGVYPGHFGIFAGALYEFDLLSQ